MVTRQTSLKKLTLKYSFFIFFAIVILFLISFWFSYHHLQQQRINIHLNNISHKAQDISSVIVFYRYIVKQISILENTKDLIRFSNNKEAHLWAKNMQKLIPQNIGIALFDANGYILGDPPELRIGRFCLHDLNLHFSKRRISLPAVHTEIKKLAHFDIIENVNDNNEVLGVLFASFSLQVLQQKLDHIVSEGQRFSIITADKKETLIVKSSKLKNDSILFSHKTKIPHTDWLLLSEIAQHDLNTVFATLVFSNLLLFLVIGILIYFFTQQINLFLKKDFNIITQHLKSLKNNHQLTRSQSKTYLVETSPLLSGVIAIAGDISSYEQQLLKISHTDELTQLPNLRYFKQHAEQQIAQANRSQKKIAFLYLDLDLDLDNFKSINDKISHCAGDHVLITIANRFRQFLRKNEFIARLGGDEFCMLIYSYKDRAELNNIVQRLINECTSNINIDGEAISINMSIGISFYPQDGSHYNELIAQADRAMYQQKHHK